MKRYLAYWSEWEFRILSLFDNVSTGVPDHDPVQLLFWFCWRAGFLFGFKSRRLDSRLVFVTDDDRTLQYFRDTLDRAWQDKIASELCERKYFQRTRVRHPYVASVVYLSLIFKIKINRYLQNERMSERVSFLTSLLDDSSDGETLTAYWPRSARLTIVRGFLCNYNRSLSERTMCWTRVEHTQASWSTTASTHCNLG